MPRKKKTRRQKIIDAIEDVAFDCESSTGDRLRALNILIGLDNEDRIEETRQRLDEIFMRLTGEK